MVKPIDEETLMGTERRPKGVQEKRGQGRSTEGIGKQLPKEEKPEKDERAKVEQKKLEKDNSANMLEFLKSCGWGT